jgi:hypothetical protein
MAAIRHELCERRAMPDFWIKFMILLGKLSIRSLRKSCRVRQKRRQPADFADLFTQR